MPSNTITKLLLNLVLISLVIAQDDPQQAISVVVGPIIGRVDTTTARVLIEFDNDAEVTVTLTAPDGTTLNSSKSVTGSIPVPFSFANLTAGTRYSVSVTNPSIEIVESYFNTLSGESGKLNFAVVSCNDRGIQASKEPQADLWADLTRRIQNNEVTYLFQIGDQVYMDDPHAGEDPNKPYFAFMRILNETAQENWDDRRDELLNILRDEYRNTWSIPSIRDALSKIPSLTILDDHQIRDDWGYLDKDRDPNTADYYYGALARQVFYEYERQLREDIDFNNLSTVTQEYYYEVFNDIGFFFVDYRGIRSWHRDYSQLGDTQLGVNQTELLQQLLEPNNGTLANATNFFLVSPLTVAFLVEPLIRIGYLVNNDAQESWSYGYSDEQASLLDTMRNWKIARPGREVTIIQGDIHMGGYTDLIYGSDSSDDFAFLQSTLR